MGRKWNNIKEKKASKDTNTSKIYAKFSKEIYVAAKQGEADPETNQELKFVVERAKSYDVPKAIIDRAIEKAKGGADEHYDALRYEGFGPNGSMIIVDTLTNNVNRTVAEVRAAFTKYGGNLGVNGSVTYMFDHLAVFGVEDISEEEVLELALEANIDVHDIITDDGLVKIYVEATQFNELQLALQEHNVPIAEFTMLAKSNIKLLEDTIKQVKNLLNNLEDLEDVQEVYHNVKFEN